MPTRCPVLFLARGATVPGGSALRAEFEVLQLAHNLATVVVAIRNPLRRSYAAIGKLLNYIMPPFPQPMYHGGQDIRGDVVTLHDPSRRGDTGGLHHVPNLSGVGTICVHASGEYRARLGVAKFGGLALPLQRPPLAARDAAPESLADTARRVL